MTRQARAKVFLGSTAARLENVRSVAADAEQSRR
jgi:hypothetical protein